MRFLSIHLPFLQTERIRRRENRTGCDGPLEPLALWAKIDNAQVLTAVDTVAAARALRPGMSAAVARGMCPALRLLEADGPADDALLAATADWCRRFTPLAALDGRDGIILDVSGVAHLFGGESGLLREVHGALAAQGFTARLSLAPSAVAASAFARWNGPAFVKDAAELEKAVRALPAASLALDAKAAVRLRDAGLRTLGDLLLRPRAPITARFGPSVFARIDAMLGRRRDPMSPRFEAPPYMAERRFAEGLARHEDIAATLGALCDELCAMLARHGEGARRIGATFFRVDGAVRDIDTATSRPSRDAKALLRLFSDRLDAIGEDGLDTGYGFDVIRLAALAVEPLAGEQVALHRMAATTPDMAAGDAGCDAFDDLVDRLGARLGTRRVMRFDFVDTHWPERAATLRPAAWGAPDMKALEQDCLEQTQACAVGSTAFLPSSAPHTRREKQTDEARVVETPHLPARPAKLFERPELIDAVAFVVPDGPPMRFRWRRVLHDVAAFEGPERIASEWWKDFGPTRDYFRVEDVEGGRFWLFREGLYGTETMTPRWYMHGVFG